MAARSVAGEELPVAVEYDRDSFATLYATDVLVSFYGEEAIREQFERTDSSVNLDFIEQEVISDVFRATGGANVFATYTESSVLVRLLLGEGSGMFLALAPGTEVTAVEATVETETGGGAEN